MQIIPAKIIPSSQEEVCSEYEIITPATCLQQGFYFFIEMYLQSKYVGAFVFMMNIW